jgi:predicted enzyme related to lactoylglutathione lyase
MTDMTDPLDVLREPVVPITPDPRFAAALRARLERALLRGAEMTEMTEPAGAVAGHVGYASLGLPDAQRGETFYRSVLGWRFAPGGGQRKRIEGLRPEMGMAGDTPDPTLFLAYWVDDVRETVRRVRAAGGQASEPEQRPYGLISDCVDDQDLPFAVYQGEIAEAGETRSGELAYLTVGVPDTARFRAFFGAVFGWRFTAGHAQDGWNVEGAWPMTGLHGGADRPRIVPMYQVADIEAAVLRVRQAGGTAADPAQRPYGLESLCTDDQGSDFYLGQF